MEFIDFPKIARLSRECFITEKIDGNNAQILIEPIPENYEPEEGIYADDGLLTGVIMRFGSRNKWLTRKTDNRGFCNWAMDNAVGLSQLGYGRHFGEWWGKGIGRGYGLNEKRFSLFNTGRWNEETKPACCHVVPVLYQGIFDTETVRERLETLRICGSKAAPNFMNPEGIVIYHVAANVYFKKTILNDEKPKGKV